MNNNLYYCCIIIYIANVQNNKKRKANRTKYIGTDRVVSEHGEVLDTQKRFRDYVNKPKYCSMYLADEHLFKALQGLGNFGAAWGYVLQKYNHENCTFYFSTTTKEDMCKELELSIGTVRNAIKSFCDSGLMLRYRGAEYLVNPSYFYRGNWDDRERLVADYEEKRLAKEVKERDKRIDSKTVNV